MPQLPRHLLFDLPDLPPAGQPRVGQQGWRLCKVYLRINEDSKAPTAFDLEVVDADGSPIPGLLSAKLVFDVEQVYVMAELRIRNLEKSSRHVSTERRIVAELHKDVPHARETECRNARTDTVPRKAVSVQEGPQPWRSHDPENGRVNLSAYG